jgi:hypothetical protein
VLRAQAIDDSLQRGEQSKVSRMELQRRREMALTISQRLEYALEARPSQFRAFTTPASQSPLGT